MTRLDLGLAAVPFAPLDAILARAAAGRATIVDVRSPSEFAADHLPGACNVPLFDDSERAMVGLLYKQFSPEAAFAEGRALVAARVEGFVAGVATCTGWRPEGSEPGRFAGSLSERVLAMTEQGIGALDAELSAVALPSVPDGAVALHCWRGGLRSRSVIALLRALGLERAIGVEGGYRSWRQAVLAGLERWPGVGRAISLRGLTGAGKTLVLRELERKAPGSTIDLEGIAGHRSSLLGMVGLEPVSQKAFEAGVHLRLARGLEGDVMFVEGESRKVGDVVVPRKLWTAMSGAVNVLLEAPIERRIEVLTADYLAQPEALPHLRAQLAAVGKRMPGGEALVELFDRGEYAALVERLLVDYYDPLYAHSERGKRYEARIDASDPSAAADELLALRDRLASEG